MTPTEFGTINATGDGAAAWIRTRLERAGLRVYLTFDLRSASDAWVRSACPRHGTEACDCQLIVLLVYHEQREPTTLVLHSHLGWTEISVIGEMASETKTVFRAALEEGCSILAQTLLLSVLQSDQLDQRLL